MTVLYATFTAADGTPEQGQVVFAPVLSAVNTDGGRHVVTAWRRAYQLDTLGVLTTDELQPSTIGWETDGPVLYWVRVG